MFYRSLLVFIFSLFWVVNANSKPRTSVVHSFPFVKVEGLMLIEAEVDNKSGYLVFDTGSDVLVIDKVDSGFTEHSVQTLKGEVKSSKVLVDQLNIGNYNLASIEAFTCNLSPIKEFTKKEIIGIIGTSYFQSYVLYIDNVNNEIQLLKRELVKVKGGRTYVRSKMWIENGVPILPLKIKGKEFRFGLDTGSSGSVISNEFVKNNLELIDQSDLRTNLLTVHEEESIHKDVCSVASLYLSQVRIDQLQFSVTSFQKLNKEFESKIDGIISLNQILVKEIFLDFQNEQALLLF